jgi:hypothetical protein
MRLSVRGRHGQPDGRRAAVHGAGRMTCLDSGTLDTGLKFEAKKG